MVVCVAHMQSAACFCVLFSLYFVKVKRYLFISFFKYVVNSRKFSEVERGQTSCDDAFPKLIIRKR